MLKNVKRIMLIAFLLVLGFFVVRVFADTKNVIKEYLEVGGMIAVLYEDGSLYVWYSNVNSVDKVETKVIVENVKDISKSSYYNSDIVFLDNDNNMRIIYIVDVYQEELDSFRNEIVVTDVIEENVKEVDEYHFLTSNNTLYTYSYSYSEVQFTKTLVMNDVKEWVYNRSRGAYLLLDVNADLFAYGTNIFGKKINDGENIVISPILLARDVRDFGIGSDYYNRPYYITNNDELYVISPDLPYPKLLKQNVTAFIDDRYYISDGKSYEIYYTIENDLIDVGYDRFVLDDKVLKRLYWADEFDEDIYLDQTGNIYGVNRKIIMNNVKEVNSNHLLLNDGTLFKYSFYYDEGYELRTTKVLDNVKKIIDEDTFIMNDETIYVRNLDKYDFNGKYRLDANSFSVIAGLPNVSDNIEVSQIILNSNCKKDFIVGNKDDYYVNVYPYNATDKSIVWESSDETVATVDQNGTMTFIAPGTTTIRVKANNSSLYSEATITVHPKNNGIEILAEDEVKVNKNQYLLLKVKITPEGTLDQKIKWSSSADNNNNNNNNENYDDIIRFYYYGDYCWEDVCPQSYDEVLIRTYASGKYTITATTEDGLYSDSITLNVVQGITSLGVRPSQENVLEDTLYMYMKESIYMDLNTVIYPSDATDNELEYSSSDESIATVDEKGRVTAKKSGKVKITIKAKNSDAKFEINILIFDETISTKIGDIDGDGIVDILDLVKLRRHIAGVEAIE